MPIPSSPKMVTVIDYDLTLNCGKELQFTLRPDLGDTEHLTQREGAKFTFGRTKHTVTVASKQIAVCSRRERQLAIPQPTEYTPTNDRPVTAPSGS